MDGTQQFGWSVRNKTRNRNGKFVSILKIFVSYLGLNLSAGAQVLATGGIVLSVLTVYSCDFFAFESTTGVPPIDVDPPFHNSTASTLGLYVYHITENALFAESISNDETCIEYPSSKGSSASQYWNTAQICLVVAIAAGSLGWIINLAEVLYYSCRRWGSMLTAFLFFAAFVLQGCTFLIFLDSDIW